MKFQLPAPCFFRSLPVSLTIRLVTMIAAGAGLGVATQVSAAPATTVDPFDPMHLLEVQLTIPKADWDTLRFQQRDGIAEFSRERLDQPVPKPYSWFQADAVIDGTPVPKIGVRKRGFYGSRSVDRPALNLDLARFTKGQSWAGLSEMRLHNNRQDPAQLRQALAYQVFTAAGVPAPRCRLAHVTVNGQDLGIYSQVEASTTIF